MSPPTAQGTSPPLKGKGKGKGGKGSPPPPPPPATPRSPPGTPASTKAGTDVDSPSGDKTLFGRKLHWVKPGYNDPGENTLFKKMSDTQLEIDNSLLTAMFKDNQKAPRVPGPAGMTPRRGSMGKALTVFDAKRAQNIAIVFGQLKSSTEEICEQLRDMNFAEPLLSADQVELVLGALPTEQEAKIISGFADNKEQLRDVERKVLPFCMLPHVDVRLKLVRSAMVHESHYQSITSQLCDIQLASKQLMESKQLFKLFAVVLQSGNLVNGSDHKKVKSFAVETLSSICTFKIGEVSMMHFLCITVHKSDPCFLQNLLDEIPNLNNASRINMSALQEEVDAFKKEVTSVERGVETIRDVQIVRGSNRLESLVATLREEATHMQENMGHAQQIHSSAQAYFGAAGTLPPSEVFFGYFVEFLSCFTAAWQQIIQCPQKWRRFFDDNPEFWEKSGAGPVSTRRPSMGGMRSPRLQGPDAVAPDMRSPEHAIPRSQRQRSTGGLGEPSMQKPQAITKPSCTGFSWGEMQKSRTFSSAETTSGETSSDDSTPPTPRCNSSNIIERSVPKVKTLNLEGINSSRAEDSTESGFRSPPIDMFGSAKGPSTQGIPKVPLPASDPGKSTQKPQAAEQSAPPSTASLVDTSVPKVRPRVSSQATSPTINLFGSAKGPSDPSILNPTLRSRSPTVNLLGVPKKLPPGAVKVLPSHPSENADSMTPGVETVEPKSTCECAEQTASQTSPPEPSILSRVINNLSPRGFNLSPRGFNLGNSSGFPTGGKEKPQESQSSNLPVSLWASGSRSPRLPNK